MTHKKKHHFFAVLFISTSLFCSCDYRVVRDYKQLVYHLNGEPYTLNPILSTESFGSSVYSFIFDPLVDRDPETLEYIPKLAKSWEISGDHLQYTFHLRDDVLWHDGVRFTADDVIFSFERIQDPKVDAARYRVYYRDVSKVEKLDDRTVRFTYAYPYFKAFSVLGGLPIIPKHVFENGGDFNKDPFGRAPIGTGPYKFQEWNTGREVILTKNENYWGKKPEIESIDFRIITDSNVALQVLKKGEIDMSELAAIQWVKQTGSKNFEERFNKHKYYLPNYYYIAWNPDRPFFTDPRVRRAMTMMVDRKKIIEKLYYGLAEIVTGDAYVFGPDYDKNIIPIPYDPAGAVSLIEESGWVDHDGDGIRDKDGVPFKFTFMTSGSKASERLTNILREELKKIGIEMEITKFEWAVFGKNLNDRAFDATMLGWTGGIEYDPYQVWHSSQVDKGSNFIGFKNAEADKIIEETRREFDPKIRSEMYKKFHQILHDDQPYTFLYMLPSMIAVQKRFTNVNVYKLGVDINEWSVTRPNMILYQ